MLVGDRVVLDSVDDTNQSARITQVLERSNQLSRPKIANITKAVVVCAVDNPPLELTQLDRYLTHVVLADIAPVLCISKVDLTQNPALPSQIDAIYAPLDIPVHFTSIRQPESVSKLFEELHGEIVVLAGLSGAGKSSLLNAYQPGLSLAVGEVSEKIQRGQHTTRQVSLIALDESTYVADTPGFSLLKFDTVSPAALESAFPEFAPYRAHCRFDNCLHLDEADCAVREHLSDIPASRYDSYRNFQEEAKEYAETVSTTSQKQEYGYKTLTKGKAEELQILKLSQKQRAASRRTEKQRLLDWETEDDTLEE